MNKREWKVLYRLIRISNREVEKAMVNQILFGSGAIFISDDGETKHIPITEISNRDSWYNNE